MTPRWLRALVRVLPDDCRDEILTELVDQHARVRQRHGRLAAWRWAAAQPWAVWRARHTHDNREDSMTLSGWPHDALAALRMIRRRPTLGLTVVATVAVSVAAIAAVTGIVDAVLLRPLPYPDAERLVWIGSYDPGPESPPFDPANAARASSNPMDVVDWAERTRTVSALAPFETMEGTILAGNQPLRVSMTSVRATIDRVLGVPPLHGRLFVEADYDEGVHVLVLSHRLWRSAFGADPAVVGRMVDVGGTMHEVIGVLPPLSPGFPNDESDLWRPLPPPAPTFQNRGGVWQRVVGRLAPGVTLDQAKLDFARVARELAEEYPKTNDTRQVHVTPYRDGVVGSTGSVLALLVGAVALVLIIACANVGHLLLVSAQGRQRELAVRAALGAQPARIARLLLAESAWLALAGGVVGLMMAPWFLRGFLRLYPETLPAVGDVSLQLPALLAASGATLAAALLAVVPALLGVRGRNLQAAIKAGERGAEHRSQRRMRAALVVTQVALSTALLVGGGLLVRTFIAMRAVDPGFNTGNVLSFNLALGQARYPELADEVRFYDEFVARVEAIPGVEIAGASTLLPFTPGEFGDGFRLVGANDVPSETPIARLQNVTFGYFEAVGLPIRKGRYFSTSDDASGPPVVIVNETLEERYFPDGALGQRIRFRGVEAEIVGVVGKKQHRSLREEPRAEMFYPRPQVTHPRLLSWVAVRTAVDPWLVLPEVQDVLSRLDPGVAMAHVDTMTGRIDRALAPDRFRAVLVALMAVVALLLAGIGLYGVVAYAVARDARTIAIRMALGSTAGQTVTRVVRHVLGLVGTGVALGAGLAWAGHTLVAGFLAGVTAFDPLTLVVVVVLIVVVALAAALGPAARASRVDPALVLRAQ
jgi:predicted permease